MKISGGRGGKYVDASTQAWSPLDQNQRLDAYYHFSEKSARRFYEAEIYAGSGFIRGFYRSGISGDLTRDCSNDHQSACGALHDENT